MAILPLLALLAPPSATPARAAIRIERAALVGPGRALPEGAQWHVRRDPSDPAAGREMLLVEFE